jgi:hypothetical protein
MSALGQKRTFGLTGRMSATCHKRTYVTRNKGPTSQESRPLFEPHLLRRSRVLLCNS